MKQLDPYDERIAMKQVIDLIWFKLDGWNWDWYVKFYIDDWIDEITWEQIQQGLYRTNTEIAFDPIFIYDLREYINKEKPFYKKGIVDSFMITNAWAIWPKLLFLLTWKYE